VFAALAIVIVVIASLRDEPEATMAESEPVALRVELPAGQDHATVPVEWSATLGESDELPMPLGSPTLLLSHIDVSKEPVEVSVWRGAPRQLVKHWVFPKALRELPQDSKAEEVVWRASAGPSPDVRGYGEELGDTYPFFVTVERPADGAHGTPLWFEAEVRVEVATTGLIEQPPGPLPAGTTVDAATGTRRVRVVESEVVDLGGGLQPGEETATIPAMWTMERGTDDGISDMSVELVFEEAWTAEPDSLVRVTVTAASGSVGVEDFSYDSRNSWWVPLREGVEPITADGRFDLALSRLPNAPPQVTFNARVRIRVVAAIDPAVDPASLAEDIGIDLHPSPAG